MCERLTVVDFVGKINAWRTDKLRYHNALGTVNDKGAPVCHERKSP
jgi:hypothetical protein